MKALIIYILLNATFCFGDSFIEAREAFAKARTPESASLVSANGYNCSVFRYLRSTQKRQMLFEKKENDSYVLISGTWTSELVKGPHLSAGSLILREDDKGRLYFETIFDPKNGAGLPEAISDGRYVADLYGTCEEGKTPKTIGKIQSWLSLYEKATPVEHPTFWKRFSGKRMLCHVLDIGTFPVEQPDRIVHEISVKPVACEVEVFYGCGRSSEPFTGDLTDIGWRGRSKFETQYSNFSNWGQPREIDNNTFIGTISEMLSQSGVTSSYGDMNISKIYQCQALLD